MRLAAPSPTNCAVISNNNSTRYENERSKSIKTNSNQKRQVRTAKGRDHRLLSHLINIKRQTEEEMVLEPSAVSVSQSVTHSYHQKPFNVGHMSDDHQQTTATAIHPFNDHLPARPV